jgi:hypothetical protein
VRRILLAFPLALFLCSRAADAGQVLKYSEEGTRDGKPYRASLTLSVAPEGVRAEVESRQESGPAKTVVFLYSAKDDKVFPIDPPTGPTISTATIAVVEERARASGHRRVPGSFTVTPLHTTHAVGAWTSSAWALRRPGQTTEIVYLADPAAVGVDASTRANLRRMGALFVPFVNAMHLAEGDLGEGFNTHALDQGFPVRELKSKDGVVEADSHLISVTNADLSPDLFRVPVPPAPAAPKASPPALAPTPTPNHLITLEGWALRGMPDPGRPWTGADYDAAAGLLETVAKEGAARLPRENSADTGRLFRRFVDPGNLASVRGAGTADERARAGAGVLSGADRISLVYAGAYRDDATRGAELAGLMAYTLLAAREVVPLADAAIAAAPEKDPLRTERLESRKRTHEALASVVNACLASLATPGGFRPAERLRLARAVGEHVPALSAYLPAGDRRELPSRLKKMSAAETDPAVKDVLDRVYAALPRPGAKAA